MNETLTFVAAFRPVFAAFCTILFPLLFVITGIAFGAKLRWLVDSAVAHGLGQQLLLLGLTSTLLLVGFAAFSSLILRQWLVVHLRPTGLAARSLRGQMVFVAFDEIAAVHVARLPFAPFWRVESRQAKPAVFIPQFLLFREQFIEAIFRIVAQNNPLRQAVRQTEGDNG